MYGSSSFSSLIGRRKKKIIILVTGIIVVLFCYSYYLNYLKISHCKYCHIKFRGNTPFCSKKCYDLWLSTPEGQIEEFRDRYIENELPDPTGRGVH